MFFSRPGVRKGHCGGLLEGLLSEVPGIYGGDKGPVEFSEAFCQDAGDLWSPGGPLVEAWHPQITQIDTD